MEAMEASAAARGSSTLVPPAAAVAIVCVLLGFSNTAAAQATAGTRPTTMNPDVSVNALMLYTNSSRGNYIDSPEANGPSIQEAEIQIFSDVDPYSKLNALFTVHQAPLASGARVGEWKFEPEELFVDTTELPYVTLRAGKFKAFMGKHNTLHTHAFPFVDAPLINSVLLGDEGINDVGLSAAYLAPLPWFSELTVQVLSGKPETDATGAALFGSSSANRYLYLAHYKNLVDVSEDLTGELGLSGATGSNEFAGPSAVSQEGATNLYGADLTFKWRPAEGGKYRAWVWATEYLNRQINRPASANKGGGFASWVQYQFAERWWLQARGDYLQVSDNDATPLSIAPFQRRYTALLGYFPSEFSGMRLQYSHLEDGRGEPEKKIYLQLNFTIGAHPAHAY